MGAQPVWLPGLIPAQLQDFAFVIVELGEVCIGSFLPAQVPVNGSSAL